MFDSIAVFSSLFAQGKVVKLNFTLKPSCGSELKIYSLTEPLASLERETHTRMSILSFIIPNTRSNSPL